MRDYKEVYREANGDMPRIYVDMDGVLCDFIVAAKRAFARPVLKGISPVSGLGSGFTVLSFSIFSSSSNF